jgi:hypothetical protein
MSVTKRSTIDPVKLMEGFKPVVPQIVKQAICEVVGECSKRPLESYADEIALAADCVRHHFGLDPKEYGIPLVTLHVAAMQLLDRLTDEVDFEDAQALIDYTFTQSEAWFDAKGYAKGDNAQRSKLWQFTVDQATAVLAGEFSAEARVQ